MYNLCSFQVPIMYNGFFLLAAFILKKCNSVKILYLQRNHRNGLAKYLEKHDGNYFYKYSWKILFKKSSKRGRCPHDKHLL